jgi:O-6-methylguanine DNA methyltransferase
MNTSLLDRPDLSQSPLYRLGVSGEVNPVPSLSPAPLSSSDSADAYAPVETPIGRLFVAFNGTVVTAVGRTAPAIEASLRARFARPARPAPTLSMPLSRAVADHFSGAGRPALRFDLSGVPAFDQLVLRAVLEIPRGQVRSYGWLAREVGQPRAAKDVGLALGQNPIPLLIPCHRVVYSDGHLGGYIFGSRAKRALLIAEGVQLGASGRVA